MQHMGDIDQMRVDLPNLIVMVVPHQIGNRANRTGDISPVMHIFRLQLFAGMQIDEGEFAARMIDQNLRESGNWHRRGGDQTQTRPQSRAACRRFDSPSVPRRIENPHPVRPNFIYC
jgi:hypothetical protein